MANRRIQRTKQLSDYLRAINEDVTKLNNRNYVTSIAANAIGSDQIGEDVVLNNKSISSSNYLAGISGWKIDGYGNSEFANVVVRGDINAYSGTIGYWNISQPLVTRTFGDYVLRGTLIESSDLGETDSGVTSGTYVGLFKSYIDLENPIVSIVRESEIVTVTVADHNYSVGDYIKIVVNEDSSFNSNSALIVDTTDTTFKYTNSGSDTTIETASGYSILAIRDIAGLYLRDYSKAEFDYGYFSNTGIAYVSAEDVNLIENPSFEYIDSGLTPVSSNVSWTAASGSTFSIEKFNDGTDPQYQFDSSYGGKVAWSSALSTYFAGRIDYLVGTSYNIFKSGRVLYLGMTMFPSYVATRSTPTAVARYNSSGSLYWRIDTDVAHGLSGGDTVLLDFDGVQFDSSLGEYIGHISNQNVTGGFTRTRTVLSSPAPTSTRFYINSGSSFTATLSDGVTLKNVDEIRAPNTTYDLGYDAYGTRPAYVYKVFNAAFNLSEVRFRFGNGSTVNLSDVLSIDTRSNWDTESNKYLISDPTLYAFGYNDASIGIPYMYKSVQTIVDANALQSSYESLDPTSYAAGTDIYIDLPAWMYSHDGAGYVSASPTKISSFAYILDNLYLSTATKTFFGGSLSNVRWASSTVEDPSYDTAQASIEGTKQWIDINLDSQTAYLDYFNYVGFKQANFSRSMLISPNITTSDSIAAKVIFPSEAETLTVTSGTYRYIQSELTGPTYVDLISSLKIITGDRDTGFELVASKKYHSGVTETILAEETALIAGYWDESSSKSIITVKAEIFTLSGQYTDYITATSSGTTIHGDLTVNGTTTTVNSTTVTVDDKNIELASTDSPSDVLADGAGITVKGTGDKTWSWIDATNSWTSNQDINIVSTGTDFRIGGTSVLNGTTLGAAIANSSLTKVAPLSGGTAGFVKVDASGNLTSTSSSASMTALMGFTTTVTSGTAVVLTNASTYYQQFTGSTAQTITLPVTSTLATGWTFHIVNNNTAGDLTVNSSGGNLVITVIPGTTAMVTCIATAGTTAANWESGLTDFSTRTGTGDVVLSISPTFTGTVNTNAITAGGLASFNNNISAFGTSTFWANQQLSLAVRNGTNYAGNLVQYSLNDTTITGGVTARGLLWAGTATGAENNFTYNLSATTPFLTSSTATFTVSTVQTYNPFAVGQRIIVSGASQAQYNGSWISTAVGGSSGAWTVTISSGSGTTPFTNSGAITATGTIALEPAAFFKAPSPGSSALVIKAAGVSGTATDPFRYFDSAGNLKTYIASSGDFVAPAISAIWSITSSAQDATVNAMRTRTSLASGYKANLQTWESSTTVLAGINNRGQFFTGGTSVLSGATTATTAASASSATVATYTVGTVSTVNPYAIGQLITTAGFSAETYFNGTFYVTAIGGSSGAWTITIVGSGFTVASATVQGTITIPIQASITPASAGTVGLVVRGTTSQAANLFEIQDSTGATLVRMNQFGNTTLSGNLSSNNNATFTPNSASTIPLTVRGAASQSVDLLQIQNSSPNTLFKVDQNGFMVAGGATVLSNALISASIYGTTQVGMAIRGTSGQTADLLVLQNNSTTSVSGFDSASNLFVNNTYRGFSTIVAAPANTTYWKIATLPISTAGTYDHIIVDALLDDSWGSNQKVHARVLLSNRNGLTYRYYLNGTVRTNSRIVVYTEADGSESVYMQLAASTYSAFSYNITHGIAGVTIYKNPTSTTTAPTGTLAFDSGNIATYVPQMYVPYTGAPQIQGNSVAYLASPIFVPSSTSAIGLIVRGLASQTGDLLQLQNSTPTSVFKVGSTGDATFGYAYISGLRDVNGTGAYLNTQSADALLINTRSTTNVGLTVRGVASQTADIFNVQDSSSGLLFRVRPNTGNWAADMANFNGPVGITPTAGGTGYGLFVRPGSALVIGTLIRGLANQNGELLTLQNSSSVNVFGANALGQIYTGSTGPILNTTTAITSASAASTTAATFTIATVSTVNPVAVGQVVTTAGFTAETYYNGSYAVSAIGGSSGAWTFTLFNPNANYVVGSATVLGTYTIPAQSSITTSSAGTKGLVVRGAASQSANLQEWQNSAGTARAYVTPLGDSSFGSLGLGYAAPYSGVSNSILGILTAGAANIGIAVRGSNSQSANLQEWQDSASGLLARITSNGIVETNQYLNMATSANAGIAVGGLYRIRMTGGATQMESSGAANVVAIVKGAASQSVNLQEWQDSASTILSYVKSDGSLYINSNSNVTGIYFKGTSSDQSIRANGNDLNFTPRFDGIFAPSDNTGRWRPATDQTSDLGTSSQRWKSLYASNGVLNIKTATDIGLVIKGASGQSANLTEWQTSAGVVQGYVYPGGNAISFPGVYASYEMTTTSGGTNVVPLKVKASASQTVDQVQYLSSGSVVLGGRNAVGQAFTGSTTTIKTAVGGTIQSIATGANPLVTTASAHNLAVGDLVTLASTTSGTYDGTFVIATVPLTTTFTITSALTAGQAGAAGTVSVPAQKSITARSAGTIGAVIKGASGQSSDLLVGQNSAGSNLFSVSSSGGLYTGSTLFTTSQTYVYGAGDYGAALNVQTRAVGSQGVIVRGRASQTANLQEWQNSAGTVLGSVNSVGDIQTSAAILAGTSSWFSATSNIKTLNAGIIGQVIRGTASQTANLQEWQNDGGTVKAQIQSGGNFVNDSNIKTPALLDTGTTTAINFGATRNVGLFAASGSFGGGAGVLNIANAATAPTSNPTGGGILYVDTGALKYRGTSGSAATIVNADGTNPLSVSPTFSTSIIGSASMDVFNTVSTTINAFGVATTINLGAGLFSTLRTINIGSAASGTGNTQTINIGVNSTTTASNNINIGGASPSVTTITGTLNQAGTTSPIQLNGSAGTSGYVLTSAGSGATPTWKDPNLVNVNATAKTAAYTLATGDYGTMVQMNGAFAFTVGTGLYNAPVGTQITLLALTAGVTVAASGANVIVNATPGLKLRAQYSTATLICLSSGASACTWLLTGDLSA